MDTCAEGKQKGYFDMFGSGHDRFSFPADVTRVTAGHGGEALLVTGSEQTALIDCGMAYCGDRMVENLKKALSDKGRDKLDYVLLSHSHYDHMGALPFIKKEMPEAVVCGSEHCRDILKRPGAKKMMKSLGTAARDLYEPDSDLDIPVEGLGVDMVLRDGDRISLGEEYFIVLETKGHTDCSLSYALEPADILFTSESTGILEGNFYVHTPVLKSFDDAFVSLEKCRDHGAKHICLPHYGMLPDGFIDRYWEMFRRSCDEKIEFIGKLKAEGCTKEGMLDLYVDRYWTPDKQQEQPKEAYVLNSGFIVDAILAYLGEK